MEKRPNNTQMVERSDVCDAEFDDRIFRNMIGICGLVSIVLTLMMLATIGIGLFALIKFVLG